MDGWEDGVPTANPLDTLTYPMACHHSALGVSPSPKYQTRLELHLAVCFLSTGY